jgi:steroid delta-isomerase-like uncharacterized protein
MADNSPEQLVRRYYEEALNTGDWDLLKMLVADTFVEHEELLNLPPTRDGLIERYTLLRTGFPDLHYRVDDLFSAGRRVAVRITVTGTHSGPFLGRPPTGKCFEIATAGIFRVDGDQIAEHWGVFDTMKFLIQLGAFLDEEGWGGPLMIDPSADPTGAGRTAAHRDA